MLRLVDVCQYVMLKVELSYWPVEDVSRSSRSEWDRKVRCLLDLGSSNSQEPCKIDCTESVEQGTRGVQSVQCLCNGKKSVLGTFRPRPAMFGVRLGGHKLTLRISLSQPSFSILLQTITLLVVIRKSRNRPTNMTSRQQPHLALPGVDLRGRTVDTPTISR